jgi:hypothetical protein
MDIIVEFLPVSQIELNYEFTKALIGSLSQDLDRGIEGVPEESLTSILEYLINRVSDKFELPPQIDAPDSEGASAEKKKHGSIQKSSKPPKASSKPPTPQKSDAHS